MNFRQECDCLTEIRKLKSELELERDAKFRAVQCAADAIEFSDKATDRQVKWKDIADSLAKLVSDYCKLDRDCFCTTCTNIREALRKYEEMRK